MSKNVKVTETESLKTSPKLLHDNRNAIRKIRKFSIFRENSQIKDKNAKIYNRVFINYLVIDAEICFSFETEKLFPDNFHTFEAKIYQKCQNNNLSQC